MLTRPVSLKTKGRSAPDPGPRVRVEAVRAGPGPGEPGALQRLVSRQGLTDQDKDGLLEHSTNPDHMWLARAAQEQWLEFEFADPVALAAVQVWNYNADWQTTNGVAAADVAVWTEAGGWEKVASAVRLNEAEGTPDYDEPTLVKLETGKIGKVRLLNLAARPGSRQIGLSKVVFYEKPGGRVTVVHPEDGASISSGRKPLLEWKPGSNAREHMVFLGLAREKLELIATTKETSLSPAVKPGQTYYWRVDEIQADSTTTGGRACQFSTLGPVGAMTDGENTEPSRAGAGERAAK